MNEWRAKVIREDLERQEEIRKISKDLGKALLKKDLDEALLILREDLRRRRRGGQIREIGELEKLEKLEKLDDKLE